MAENGHSCKRCREWMVDILYPEDLERMPAEMEAHVRDCAACTEELESLKQMLSAIRKVDLQIRPPARLESAIMSAIEREVRGARAARPAVGLFDVLKEKLGQLFQAARPLVAHPAFAAAMLVLVVGGFLLVVKDAIWQKPVGTPAEERSIVLPPVGEVETAQPAAPYREGKEEAGVAEEPAAVEKAAEAGGEGLEEEGDKAYAAGLDGDEDLKKTPGSGTGERAVTKTVEEEKALEKNMVEDQKVTGKEGGMGGYGSVELKAADADYPFKDKAGAAKAGAGEAVAGEESAAGLAQDMPEASVATKGKTATAVDMIDETVAEKKPAAEGKAVATPGPAPSPSPYPFDYGSSPPSAGGGVKKKKSTTYWLEEEAPAEPAYGKSDDLSSMPDMEKDEAESESYAADAPAKAGGKKKGGGWLAKYKAKKEAKKAAKAKKEQGEVASGTSTAAAPAAATQATKTDKAAKDPYVQARDYYQSGDYDSALKVLNAVLKTPSSTSTNMAYIYHLLGKVWNKKGSASKALANYETIFSKYPSYAYIDQARWEAALLYIAKGDKASAKKLLEKLLSSPQFKEKAQQKLQQL